MKIWKAIETAPEKAAKKDWQRWLDPMFDQVNQAWLSDTKCRVESVPCTNDCGCNHRVQQHGNGFVGICSCGKSCSDIPLSADDVKELKLSLDSLGFELAKALGCTSDKAELGLHRTKQVASFGDECVPIILTIQPDQESFHKIVRQLVKKLKRRFILLAPTNRFAGENSLGLLKQARAHFFSLGPNVRLWPSGKLQATKRGEEWFSPYLREDSNLHAASESAAERKASSTEGDKATELDAQKVNRIGRLGYLLGFNQVWLGEKLFDLSNRPSARACIQYLVEKKAIDPKSARHLVKQIDPYVRKQCKLPRSADIRVHHYFNDEKGKLPELRKELIKAFGDDGRYYLNVS